MSALRRLAVVLVVLTSTGTALAQPGPPVVFAERFVRQPGKPQTIERTIVVPPWVVAPFTMAVQNGEPGVSDPVPAWIWVNGVRVASPPDGSLARTVVLGPRATIAVRLTGDRQRSVAVTITGTSGDHTAPQVTLAEPTLTVLNADSVAIRWRYTDFVGGAEPAASGVSRSSIRITADGTDLTSMFAVDDSEAHASLPLAEGSHTLQASMSDVAGNQSSLSVALVVDRTPPELTLTIPVTEAVIANAPVTVRGEVIDATAVTVAVDGAQANVAGHDWSASITPAGDGDHSVTVVAIDAAGNETRLTQSFVLDTTVPVVRIADPAAGTATTATEMVIRATVDDLTVRSVTLNGILGSVTRETPSTYEAVVPLSPGDNLIVVTATDATGRIGIAEVSVTRIIENPCEFAVFPTAVALPAEGGSGVFVVSTSSGCDWTASTNADWVTVRRADAGYAADIATDGAAGFWRLDEDATGAIGDASGNALEATLFGNYTQQVAGALGDGNPATLFEGGSAQFATGPPLLGGPFSVEAWIREPWWGTLAAGVGWQLTIDSGRVRFRAERNEVERFNVRSERFVDDFEWHYVVATYDPAQQTTSIFIDGVLDAAGPTSASPLNGGTFFMIGPISATLDEVAVYRSALTAAQIASHFDKRMSVSGGSGSVGYTVAPNPSQEARNAILEVAGVAVAVAQASAQSAPPDDASRPLERPGFGFAAAAGQRHMLALKDDGRLWSWGANDSSQLGDGTTVSRPLPVQVADRIVAVAAGDAHSLALKSDGTVSAFGANGRGQLGLGTVSFQSAPVDVPGLTNVVAIAAGSEHSAALTADGTVWTWGRNIVGQLGAESGEMRTVPAPVSGMTSPAVAIAAAGTRTLVVDAAGGLWEFGAGISVPSQVQFNVPVIKAVASASGWYALGRDGSVWASASNGTVDRIAIDMVSALAAAASYTLIVRSGSVSTSSGGIPMVVSGPENVVAISANANGSANIAIAADGRVWTWGDNSERQLGDGTTVTRVSPQQIADGGFTWRTGTPVMTAGGTFTSEWMVRAASATPDAVVHYTMNGAEPTEADPLMPVAPASIPITATTTVRTRAWAVGKPPSGIATETYELKVPAVRVTPAGGNYAAEQLVTIAGAGNGVAVRYTVDGTEPTVMSRAYTAPITIASGTVLKASAFRAGWTPSDVTTEVYAVDVGTPPDPPILPPPPSQTGCSYGLTPVAVAASSQPTTGELTVAASDESCGWSVESDVSWLSVTAIGQASPYAQVVVADQPIGYWRLTEPAGATVADDASPFGRGGVVSGGVTFGRPGPLVDGSTAAAFDGRTGAIEIGHDAGLDLSTLTWEAWVNVPTISNEWRWILGQGGIQEVFSLWIAPGSRRATLYYDLAGGGREAVLLNATVVGGGWVHLAFAYGPTSWRTYVNGAEDQNGPSAGALATTTGPIVFGRDYAGESWYDGELADAALYPYVLGADAIAEHVAQRTVMVRGVGRVAYTIEANAMSIARNAAMTIAGRQVPVSQAPPGALAIAAGMASAAVVGSSGWSNSDVTVMFACAGDGVIACPAPVTVSREGEQDVTGETASAVAAGASTTVRVRVDKTAPYLSVSTPSLGQLVSAGEMTIRGSTIDLLSGLTGVTCDGQPATVSDTQFTCSVAAAPGTSTVMLRATDVASNVREIAVSVLTEDAVQSAPPMRLRLTPQTVTMTVGEVRRFSVVDDLGRIPALAEWTIDNAAVATLTTTPRVELTAVSAGEVVLEARWLGLTATATVTVLGVAAPIGTTIWSQPPIRGSVQRIVQGAVALDNERRIYALEHADGTAQDLIRAFDADGTEMWAATVPGRVLQLSGDPFGGVVALHDTTLTGFTPGGHSFPIGLRSGPGFAIDANGAVYYIREGVLVAGNGTLPLPQPETPDGWIDPGVPTVLEDGRIAVPVHVVNTGLTTNKLLLVVNSADGGMSVRTVWESAPPVLSQDGTWGRRRADAVLPYKAVPNGRGDVLVAWSAIPTGLGDNSAVSANVAIVRADGQPVTEVAVVGGTWGSPGAYPYGDLVVAEDRLIATAYRLFDQQNEAVASQLTLSGFVIAQNAWSAPEDQVPQLPTFLAAAGGGFVVSYPDGTMGGDDPAFSAMRLAKAQYQGNGTWIGATNRGPAAVVGPAMAEANSVWSASQGSEMAAAANRAVMPGRGIFAKGHSLAAGLAGHISIRVAPQNQDRWLQWRPDLFSYYNPNDGTVTPNYDGFRNRFFTLGAGPDGPPGMDFECTSNPRLVSAPNRDKDVYQPPEPGWFERLPYSPLVEDVYINRLLERDENYGDDLKYECRPDPGTDEFNSNSYAAGLLDATWLGRPKFPSRTPWYFPGWSKPVPPEQFRPR